MRLSTYQSCIACFLVVSCAVFSCPRANAYKGQTLVGKSDRLQGSVHEEQHFWRSVGVGVTGDSAPYRISRIEKGSAAENAKLAVNDSIIHARMAGKAIVVDGERAGRRFTATIMLGGSQSKEKAPERLLPTSASLATTSSADLKKAPQRLESTPPRWGAPSRPSKF